MVTHGPPLGIRDRTADQLNVGCENLLKKVKKIKPKYHLFGHIHEGYGILNTETTTFINGSILNENYQLVNQPVFFDFSKNLYPKRLYLDDLRPTPEGFERAYDFEEFVKYISQNGLPDFISFDHDLGEGKTGLDCAKFLVEYCLDNQIHKINFQVHSQNPVGKENIEFLLKNFNKKNYKDFLCRLHRIDLRNLIFKKIEMPLIVSIGLRLIQISKSTPFIIEISVNAGISWEIRFPGSNEVGEFIDIFRRGETIFATTTKGRFRSVDAGQSWMQI